MSQKKFDIIYTAWVALGAIGMGVVASFTGGDLVAILGRDSANA